MTAGNLNTTFQNCLCLPGVTGPFDWHHQVLVGSVVCGGTATTYAPFPLPPALPPVPTGFATMPIGGWTVPTGVFPDGRKLLIHCGTGARAASAASLLSRFGFTVALVNDEWANWAQMGDVVTGSKELEPTA